MIVNNYSLLLFVQIDPQKYGFFFIYANNYAKNDILS